MNCVVLSLKMVLSSKILTVVVLCWFGTSFAEDVSVNTRLGTIIGKKVETSFNGKTGKVNVFRGIPYAEAPTGTRRFRKPVPKANLPNPYNASNFGPACPQDLFMMMGWVPGYPYVDEDCLSVNVFTPENANVNGSHGSYAVMVWIYGGAYVIGQSKMYSGENLTLVGDVIVVTLNYRITSLGFLSTGSSKYPGNAGLWDQQLAIKWVHDNIADFKGDPNRVTIFGESAGGSSVLFQALYPGNKGLFQRLIAESGSPLCPWAYQPDPKKYARMLANKLGCSASDLDIAVDCLQKLDAMTVVNNSRVGSQDDTVFRAEWVPSYDGNFITRPQEKMFRSGIDMFKDLDFMVGVNNNDGAFVTLLAIQPYMVRQINQSFDQGIPRNFFKNFYIPMYLKDYRGNASKITRDVLGFVYTDWRDQNNVNYTREKFLQFSGDYNFFMPILSSLRAHAQSATRAKSFLYEFHVRPTFNHSPSWVEGANHGEELPFVFGFPDLMADGMGYRNNVPAFEKQISTKMMTLWSNFAKTGDPNFPVTVPDSVVWPEYNLDTKRFLMMERNSSSVSHNLFGSRAAFWLELEPEIHALTSKSTHQSGMGMPSIVG